MTEGTRARNRTCVGCRRTTARSELVRIGLIDGVLTWSNGDGRGAWLCADSLPECLAEAARVGGFSRAFRQSVPVGENEVERLLASRVRVGSGTWYGQSAALG